MTDVSDDAYSSQPYFADTVYAFDEQSGVTLTNDISDVYLGGVSTNLGTVSAGTPVNSTYLFVDADPAGTNVTGSGTVVFSTQILGIVWKHAGLNGTDDELGLSSITYPSDVGGGGNVTRGAGGFPSSDVFSFAANTVTFNLTKFTTGSGNYDSVRILTAVPAPAAGALFLVALLGMGVVGRKRA